MSSTLKLLLKAFILLYIRALSVFIFEFNSCNSNSTILLLIDDFSFIKFSILSININEASLLNNAILSVRLEIVLSISITFLFKLAILKELSTLFIEYDELNIFSSFKEYIKAETLASNTSCLTLLVLVQVFNLPRTASLQE